MKAHLPLFALVMILQYGGCVDYPRDYRLFRKQDPEKQREQFSEFPLEKQVDYLRLCAPTNGCIGFELDMIAVRGESSVPYLLDRMDSATDAEKYYIACVFERMDERYAPVDNQETKTRLKTIVKSMNDPDWRFMTQAALKQILNSD